MRYFVDRDITARRSRKGTPLDTEVRDIRRYMSTRDGAVVSAEVLRDGIWETDTFEFPFRIKNKA